MNDYIKYSGENLAETSKQCENLFDIINNISEKLSAVDTSGRWWLTLEMRPNYESVLEAMQFEIRNANAILQKIQDIISGIRKTIIIFDTVEKENIARFTTGDALELLAQNGEEENLTASNINAKDDVATTEEEYFQRIQNRRNHAYDREVARLYDQYKNKINITKINDERAQYNPRNNHVYINWELDASNPRGEGTTYYHEVGHMIDDYTKLFGDSSSSERFSKALKSDFENYVNGIMDKYGCSQGEAYGRIKAWLLIDMHKKNGVSDLCSGLSKNKCIGLYGHNNEYWNRNGLEHGIPERLNNEAFAHFFEASMAEDPIKIAYIREIFPNAYDEFKQIVRDNIEW